MSEKKSNAKYKRVLIKWNDAQTLNETMDISEALKKEPFPRETIGYLLLKTKDKIVLCSTYDHGDQQVDTIHVFPREWVTHISELK